jgi:hypothetical protein
VQDKLKSVAKDRCPILEPRPVRAWETTTVFIEIPYFPPSPVLALKAVSQLLWPDKDREVWFSLGENHEKACHFGLHQLRNCPCDTPKMALRFLANTTPLPESAAV